MYKFKVLFLVIVFSNSLFGVLLNDINNSIQYDEALKVFKQKDYKISYKLFYKLFLDDLENLNVNFYLARSSFELKNYDEAISAYERIIIQKPTNSRVQLELARCYFMQQNYQEAKMMFMMLKKKEHPINVVKNIDRYLAIIDKKISKHSFSGMFMGGVVYDSNLNNKASSDNFYIPKYSVNFVNSTKDVSALAHQEVLIFNHKYKYNRAISLKNNFMFYNKSVNNNSDKNVQFTTYNPALSYSYKNNLIIDYGLFIDRLWFGSVLLLDSYGIVPKVNYKYSNNLIINSFLKYQIKSNKVNSNKDKDSKYLQFNLSLNKTLSETLRIIPSIVFENERKDGGTLTNIDYDSLLVGVGLNYKYSNKISIFPKLTYKEKKYKEIDSNYLVKQKNDEYNYNLTGTYLFDIGVIGQGILNYSDVDSNIEPSKYKKYTVSINFIKPF